MLSMTDSITALSVLSEIESLFQLNRGVALQEKLCGLRNHPHTESEMFTNKVSLII